MDFTLKLKDSEEHGFPDHKSNISFYVIDADPFHLTKKLHPQYTEITYEWYSECREVQEYYDPKTESHFKLGDCRTSCFPEDDNISHRTVYLCLCMGESVFNIRDKRFVVPRIAWQYSHDIQRVIASYQGDDYFPCFDINNLLREGIVKPLEFDKVEVGKEGNKYYHVYGKFLYKGKLYYLHLYQDCKWEDDDWVAENKYGKVDVFKWRELQITLDEYNTYAKILSNYEEEG